MSRPAVARINLTALRHNLARVRELAPAAKVMAVVKANGYGHGAVHVASALADADALAVASIEEAVELRKANVTRPILLLEGLFDTADLDLALWHELWMVVHNEAQLNILKAAANTNQAKVWLKLDSGMHRLGIPLNQTQRVLAALNPQTLMTHLACADEPESDMTAQQLAAFDSYTASLGLPRSVANSAGILGWPETHADWVRPGIMLYGASPFAGKTAADDGLQAVMTLSSELIAVQTVSKGETVGYGATWQAERDTRIGVVAIGYADGYPRHAKNGTPVQVNGKPAPLAGRVSMDMITVDLADQPEAKIGDKVVLWGDGLPIEKVAEFADTIAYELLTKVRRVRFDYCH